MPALRLLLPALILSLTAGCGTLASASKYSMSCRHIEADMRWGALSGLAADTTNEAVLYAVHDHNLPHPKILVLDVSGHQAIISRSIPVLRNGSEPPYDLEGITRRGQGGFWLASEGKRGRGRPNLIIHTDESGQVLEEIPLPPSVAQYRIKAGFEGIASTGTGDREQVVVVFQRSWKDDQPGQVKIGQYWPARAQWRFYRYPLDRPKSNGLSAAVFLDDGTVAVLERDNKPLYKARTKAIYKISLPSSPDPKSAPPYPLLEKTRMMDILSSYSLACGTDGKLEGMALTPGEKLFLVADDDGKGHAMLLQVPK